MHLVLWSLPQYDGWALTRWHIFSDEQARQDREKPLEKTNMQSNEPSLAGSGARGPPRTKAPPRDIWEDEDRPEKPKSQTRGESKQPALRRWAGGKKTNSREKKAGDRAKRQRCSRW